MQMRKPLQRQRADYEAARQALLAAVAALSPEVLNTRPLAGGWSVLEIVEHLALAERDVLRGLPALEALVVRPRSFLNRIRRRVLLAILRSRLRVPTPSTAMNPSGDRSLEEVRSLWDENAVWLCEFVNEADEETLAAPVFMHPVSGPLTVVEVLVLAGVHLGRHREQIQALIGAVE